MICTPHHAVSEGDTMTRIVTEYTTLTGVLLDNDSLLMLTINVMSFDGWTVCAMSYEVPESIACGDDEA
jgi:hypothetical protein